MQSEAKIQEYEEAVKESLLEGSERVEYANRQSCNSHWRRMEVWRF